MLLLQAHPSSELKLLIIALLAALIIWRLLLLVKPRRQKNTKDSSKAKSSNRREIIRSMSLHDIEPSMLKKKVNPLWQGLLFVMKRQGLAFSTIVFAIGAIWVIYRWLVGGYISETGIIITLSLMTLIFVSPAYSYFQYYNRFPDLPELIRGLFSLEDRDKFAAFKKAATIYPSEFAYTMLGIVQRRITEMEEQRIGKWSFEYDYSRSIDFYAKASSLRPNEVRPLEASFKLKAEMKNFEGAISDFQQIRVLEQKTQPITPFATEFCLALLLQEWGEVLVIRGEYENAVEKFSEGISQIENLDAGNYHPLWSLSLGRAKAYLKLGEYNHSVKDLYNGVEFLIASGRAKIPEIILDSEVRKNHNNETLLNYLNGAVELAYSLFKVQEDQSAAIKFLEYFITDQDDFASKALTRHLVTLLISSGQADKGIKLYKDYLSKGREKFRSIEVFSNSELYQESKILEGAINLPITTLGRLDLITKAYHAKNYPLVDDAINRALKTENLSQEYSINYLLLKAQMREDEWKFTEALKLYVEIFSIREETISNEKIIGTIRKNQRVFSEAADAFEGYFHALKDNRMTPSEEEVYTYAQVYEEIGDYSRAMKLLSAFNIDERNSYFMELRRKKRIKERS